MQAIHTHSTSTVIPGLLAALPPSGPAFGCSAQRLCPGTSLPRQSHSEKARQTEGGTEAQAQNRRRRAPKGGGKKLPCRDFCDRALKPQQHILPARQRQLRVGISSENFHPTEEASFRISAKAVSIQNLLRAQGSGKVPLTGRNCHGTHPIRPQCNVVDHKWLSCFSTGQNAPTLDTIKQPGISG